jgi:non-heme chloroperoxidase
MNRRAWMVRGGALATSVAAASTKSPAFAQISSNDKTKAKNVSRQPSLGNYITTRDGTQLFVRDWGRGEPIVFLAGWCLISDSWGYQMPALIDKGFRCIAYDRRGHGKSADPGSGYDYDTLADDLADLLEQRNLERVTLVAHSMASGEVIRYMARHGGKRVAKIAMLGPTAPAILKTTDNPIGIPREAFDKLRQELREDFPDWLQRNSAPFVVHATSQSMRNWLMNHMNQTSMQAVLDCNRIMIETDFRAELKAVRTPILVIHGDLDASAPLPLTGKRVAEIAPNARLKIYEKAPHGLFVTHARELNADLIAFAS